MEQGSEIAGAADVTTATASNVQREPSMEEILASIRRIIEDSDTGRRPADAFDDARAVTEEAKPAPVDASRDEIRPSEDATTAKPSGLGSGQHPPFTRLDFARPAAAEEATSHLPDPADWRLRRDEAATPPHVEGADRSDPEPAAAAPQSPISGDGREAGLSGGTTETRSRVADNSAPEAAASRPVLISEKAGLRVTAAFEELSEVFAARSKKSLDEMAEDMLRPMLQEWLDTNLPDMVERLVREEIERVTHGA